MQFAELEPNVDLMNTFELAFNQVKKQIHFFFVLN